MRFRCFNLVVGAVVLAVSLFAVSVDGAILRVEARPGPRVFSVGDVDNLIDPSSLIKGGPALWEPIETGFWIRYRIDTVRSLDQQYRP